MTQALAEYELQAGLQTIHGLVAGPNLGRQQTIGDYSGGMTTFLPPYPPQPRFYESKHSREQRRRREATLAVTMAFLAGVACLALIGNLLLPALLVLCD